MSTNNRKFVDQDFSSSTRSTNIPNIFATQKVPTDFNIIQSVLSKELEANVFYKNAWAIAEAEFKKKKQSRPEHFTPSTEDECYIALIAYTLDEPPLYEDFNKQFRQLKDVTSWAKFPYKSLFFLLKLSEKRTMNKFIPKGTIYRAIGHHFSPDPNESDLFFFDYFASCSTNLSVAQNCARPHGIVIELQNGAKKSINMQNYSVHPEEKEVVVLPSNKFKIVKFIKNEAIPRLVLYNVPAKSKRFVDTEFLVSALPCNMPNPFANKQDIYDVSEEVMKRGETSATGIRRRRDTSATSPPSKTVYDYFHVVKKILDKELANDMVYDHTWKMAEKELQVKKQILPPEYFNPDTPDECYIAVIAYTINTTKLYRHFNRGFRMLADEASWKAFPYKSLYYLLTLALPGIINDPDPCQDLYRGMHHHFDPEPVVGDPFYYDYFASHTVDLVTAKLYLKGSGTLIKIPGGAQMAIGISKYSMFEEEKEVLVFPRNKFIIKEFMKDESAGIDVLVLQWVGIE